jgi:hypothetical protein
VLNQWLYTQSVVYVQFWQSVCVGIALQLSSAIVAVGTEKRSTFVQSDSTDHNDVLITRIAEGN